jgi:oligopeptide transport system substrate-binding protein
LFCFINQAAAESAAFSLSLSEIPKSFDPHLLRSSSGQYVQQQLYRNFYRLTQSNEFAPELGEKCLKKPSSWICEIKKSAKWSDGTDITASDFLKSYQRLLTLPSPRAQLLFSILNAEDIFNKKKPLTDLGFKVLSPKKFEIQWQNKNEPAEFLLMSPLFVPLKNGDQHSKFFSGPYQVSSSQPTELIMQPNPHYFKKNQRPQLNWILFDENLAYQAFDNQKLDFLRRVPTSRIPELKNQPDFFQSPVLRLDSLFFGPELKDNLELRKQLIQSLDYEQMQKLFNSDPRPGCVGVPLIFYSGPEVCYPNQKLKVSLKKQKALQFSYSSLGGEDHRRLSEWLQSEWRKQLGLQIQVRGLENKIFLNQMRSKPTAIFRRGLSPENPTCHGALESFHSTSSDNLSILKDAQFDELLLSLKQNSSLQKCREVLQYLLDQNIMIPTGRIFFSFRMSQKWQGMDLNLLNHMDLSELTKKIKN